MCELLAICARRPTSFSLSFEELARHGDRNKPNHDGWGTAFVREHDALVIKEPCPAGNSAMARFIADADIESTIVISHIRRATCGRTVFENTHPFSRELGGRSHVFAHNGSLPGARAMELGSFRPLGETDSEHAFCALLARLEPRWRRSGMPSLRERGEVVAEFAEELRAMGPANFLYTDTDSLFVHSHRRSKEDDAEPDRPGLHILHRDCPVQLGGIRGRPSSDDEQRVHLVATVPLSDEAWQPMGIGELAVFRGGKRVDGAEA
ncbi:MAG: class II glutamine amidotransferase [Myxococcales bacterium]|nr:class II glutamine amidotransferase [Myxococcales bacterium]